MRFFSPLLSRASIFFFCFSPTCLGSLFSLYICGIPTTDGPRMEPPGAAMFKRTLRNCPVGCPCVRLNMTKCPPSSPWRMCHDFLHIYFHNCAFIMCHAYAFSFMFSDFQLHSQTRRMMLKMMMMMMMMMWKTCFQTADITRIFCISILHVLAWSTSHP